MPATGDETVKLSQFKEWSDTLGGGFSPATSEVTITNRSVYTKTIRYMGVDGSCMSKVPYQGTLKLEVPIMSMITSSDSMFYVEKGGLGLVTKTIQGTEQDVILVTDTTCVIRITG